MLIAISLLAALSVVWIFWELTRKRVVTSSFRDDDGYVDTNTALANNESTIRTIAKWRLFRRLGEKSRYRDEELLNRYGNPEQLNPAQFLAQKALFSATFAIFGLFTGAVLGVVLGLTGSVAVTMFALVVGGSSALLGPYYAVRRLKKRSKVSIKAVDAYLFELMELVAAFMGDGGVPVREAIIRSGPYLTNPYLAEEVDRISADLSSGVPFPEAMARMRDRIDTPNVSSFANKMIVAAIEGSISSDELVADAKSLRADRVTKIKDRAQTAQTVSLLVILVGFAVSATVAFFWPVIQEVIIGG